MRQPDNENNDRRFWACFADCLEQLVECSEESDLPVGWWTWPLVRRAEELRGRIRKSVLPNGFDVAIIATVAIGALMVGEQKPSHFTPHLRERAAAMKDLVEQKGQDYNSGDVSILEYWLLGQASIVHEIHKRALRLVSIGRSGQRPQFESVPEIGLDIAAYALFLLAYERAGISRKNLAVQ